MEEEFVDVWRMYGFSDHDDADEIIREVDMNVLKLVEKALTTYGTQLLIQVGRKSAHLISHYKIRLDEQGYLTCLYRKHSGFLETTPDLPIGMSTIIIADAIHTGEECRRLLQYLYSKTVLVKKIFCYLVNVKGLEALHESNLLELTDVEYLFSSNTEEEYNEESSKLQVFYRSRIEPMDPEVSFNQYNINKLITRDDIIKILRPLEEITSGCKINVVKNDERGFRSNVKELLITIHDCAYLDELKNEIVKPSFDSLIDGLSIRIKINQKLIDSDFTVIVKSENDCIPNTDPSLCLNNIEDCILRKTTYHPNQEEEIIKITCPRCLDLLLSRKTLDILNDQFFKGFSNQGVECTLVREYRSYF